MLPVFKRSRYFITCTHVVLLYLPMMLCCADQVGMLFNVSLSVLGRCVLYFVPPDCKISYPCNTSHTAYTKFLWHAHYRHTMKPLSEYTCLYVVSGPRPLYLTPLFIVSGPRPLYLTPLFIVSGPRPLYLTPLFIVSGPRPPYLTPLFTALACW